MIRFVLLSGLIILVSLASLSLAEIPKLINYQGMLTDESGDPVDGNPNIIFRIYDDTTGGTQKWTETHFGVPVTNGLFNVILGSDVPIDTLSFSQQYWLEVQVDDDTMSRLRFTSVGYAYRAERADTAGYALSSPSGPGDYTWTFRITDTADTTITTGGGWGIARSGNILHGNADSTHVNLGGACTTGTSGQNYKYCTVGGGYHNTAGRDDATVGGGVGNTASQWRTTVGGGDRNSASGDAATVGGGLVNSASGGGATVGGGSTNIAGGYSATVGGGSDNTASGGDATVGGGSDNTASGVHYATVGGGHGNIAGGYSATVGGGYGNNASGYSATAGGGYYNHASGGYATVAGGRSNTASGNYSFAAGRRAKANHLGTFVWADSSVNADFASTGNNQFLIRASGGVGIGVTNPEEMLEIENANANQRVFLKIQASHPTEFEEVGIRLETPQNRWHLRMDDYANDNLPDTGSLALRSQNSGIEVMTWTDDGNVGIGTTNPNHRLDVEGYIQAYGYYTGDIIFQKEKKKLWRMFEDEDGLYLENLKTGKIYTFVLQEVRKE